MQIGTVLKKTGAIWRLSLLLALCERLQRRGGEGAMEDGEREAEVGCRESKRKEACVLSRVSFEQSALFCCAVPSRPVLCRVVLCCVVLCSGVVWCAVPCSAVLSCPVQCSAVQCGAVRCAVLSKAALLPDGEDGQPGEEDQRRVHPEIKHNTLAFSVHFCTREAGFRNRYRSAA